MVGTGNANDWYCLLRNVQGAAALPEILNGNLKHMLQAGMSHFLRPIPWLLHDLTVIYEQSISSKMALANGRILSTSRSERLRRGRLESSWRKSPLKD